MRLSLATTLKNRRADTDKDPRLLNCVVDSKKRVLKRPSLVGTYEVTTPGAGLGLFVRTTPGAPGVPATPELVTIVGSVMTTSPAVYVAVGENFSLDAADSVFGPNTFGFGLGDAGSITPSTFNGNTINRLYSNSSNVETEFAIVGNYTQSYFTSMTVNGVTLLTADATFSTPGGESQWFWTGTSLFNSAGAYTVLIV